MKALCSVRLRSSNKSLIFHVRRRFQFSAGSLREAPDSVPHFELIIPRPKGEEIERHMFQDDRVLPIFYESIQKSRAVLKDQTGWFSWPKYISQEGFNREATKMLFGDSVYNSEEPSSKKILTFQTQTISQVFSAITNCLNHNEPGNSTVYLPNVPLTMHETYLQDCGLTTQYYRYYDSGRKAVDIKGFTEDIDKNIPNGSIILLHLCAHNPTGLDIEEKNWLEILRMCKRRNHIILLDCSMQGFSSGHLDFDAFVARVIFQSDVKLIAFQSMSYLFGLYAEEELCVLHIVCDRDNQEKIQQEMQSFLSAQIRGQNLQQGMTLISNILQDETLSKLWKKEIRRLAFFVNSLRVQIVDHLVNILHSQRDWTFLVHQRGLYCHFNFTQLQISRMRTRFSLFITDYGRMSLIGVTADTIVHFADALHEVTRLRADDKQIFSRLTPQLLRYEQMRLAEEKAKSEAELRRKEKLFMGNEVPVDTGEDFIPQGRKRNEKNRE